MQIPSAADCHTLQRQLKLLLLLSQYSRLLSVLNTIQPSRFLPVLSPADPLVPSSRMPTHLKTTLQTNLLLAPHLAIWPCAGPKVAHVIVISFEESRDMNLRHCTSSLISSTEPSMLSACLSAQCSAQLRRLQMQVLLWRLLITVEEVPKTI